MVSSSKSAVSSSSISKDLEAEFSHLKNQIESSRLVSIRDKIQKNKRNLEHLTQGLFDAAGSRGPSVCPESENLLSVRAGAPHCKLGGWDSIAEFGEKEIVNSQEEITASGTVMFGGSGGGKIGVMMVKLPFVEKIPPYTTWIFLDRNQRMADDQSVVGRRRIYYDSHGNETLICSDSDEEITEPEEPKYEFSEGEDLILWKMIQEHEEKEDVLGILSQFIKASPSEIEERYEALTERYQENLVKNSEASAKVESNGRQFLDKTLSASLDSLDNLFCRRCLIFDCRLHGCSQPLIVPSEKQSYGLELEESRSPCGDQCYLKQKDGLCDNISYTSSRHVKESATLADKPDNTGTSKAEETSDTSNICIYIADALTDIGKRKVLEPESMPLRNSKPAPECMGSAKKQKKLSPSDSSLVSELETCPISFIDTECPDSGLPRAGQFGREATSESIASPRTDICQEYVLVKNPSRSSKRKTIHSWNTLEKDLYFKGIEIFGKNSCLIARNLLSGLKTCMEVSNYMFDHGAALSSRTTCIEDSGRADQYYMDQDMPPRARIWRRRGRGRKLKYTWKSAGHPSVLRKRIGDGKQQACKQYTPCSCQLMCGKECPCMHNGTCCEKYCGCSKGCKNRFRGCHCAKSQCRSRQCPCFAAGRECDPDVCRNCWVSCGDGSLGEPPARDDGYQCGNMKLLLKQQQRILLARSNIAGWGAFTKNPVNKNDYLGEYTGELISHKEADKRGKIYDRANSSFLFDLNDQYVLDAYRKGDKLKFANHSSNPNCYAKVMLVAGDHRVGIFAKEHIEASEELFYDYRYGPDQAPAWARKTGRSKRDEPSASHSRAQKVARY